MGDAAYLDNGADAFGPGTRWTLLQRPALPGSSVAARIVDCTPQRQDRGEIQAQGRRQASVPRFRAIRAATRGLIAAPWTPASLSLLPEKKRHEPLTTGCH